MEKCDRPMDDFRSIYNLFSLIKVVTCYKNPSKPNCIDLMLINSPESFYNSCAIQTGLSDFHKMTIIIMKTTFRKQEPKIIHYWNYNFFSKNSFKEDLLLEASSNGHALKPDNLAPFVNAGMKALNRHVPVTKRYVRTNQTRFMNKNLKKDIMIRAILRTIFLRNRSDENRTRSSGTKSV